ncbi:MAG TPA: ribonuclease HII [Burkholderiaceae bacterium]|nr:ribonuclease HII [Burkholderiaceae bacterium]
MKSHRSSLNLDLFEQIARQSGRICGIDEAGRGPLAGPVTAAAVILDPTRRILGLADSKVLTPERREDLALKIRERAIAYAVAEASVDEIDTINILQATLLAMRRAVEGLQVAAEYALVDGNQMPRLPIPGRPIVAGDATERCISAASILAKTARDARMRALDVEHPGYGFAQHMGYATAEHLHHLRRLGPCRLHRQSFAPVREWQRLDPEAVHADQFD